MTHLQAGQTGINEQLDRENGISRAVAFSRLLAPAKPKFVPLLESL
jgi:hypothetical protein